MSTIVWETVKSIHCERVDQDAALIEKRIYAAEILPDTGKPVFRIEARKCSLAAECTIKGCPCRWTGVNPNYDPFVG